MCLGNDNNEEWEAELEGELNEFEMVNSKEEDPEWENQIQQMLEAEESKQNIEPFGKDESRPRENMWSDVTELMRNDPSIIKIHGKRMRKTMKKFE